MEQTIASSTSKCDTQSGKIKFSQCRILHALHKLHKKRARKTTVVKADSSVTLIAPVSYTHLTLPTSDLV